MATNFLIFVLLVRVQVSPSRIRHYAFPPEPLLSDPVPKTISEGGKLLFLLAIRSASDGHIQKQSLVQ